MKESKLVLSSSALANGLSISYSYLQQACRGLREHNIVNNHKGRNGGCRLCKPIRKLTITEALDAMPNAGLSFTNNRKIDYVNIENVLWNNINLGFTQH